MRTIKCVIVGDPAAGKTSLLVSYMVNKFPTKYHPTPFDYTFTVHGTIGGEHYKIYLRDTRGHEDHDRLRPLSYGQTDVCIICFSITSPKSLENITEKWYPEVNQYCPRAPRILVATHVDKRVDPQVVGKLSKRDQRIVTRKVGESLAKDIGAKYIECSALTQEGLTNVIDEVVIAALKLPQKYPEQTPQCIIL